MCRIDVFHWLVLSSLFVIDFHLVLTQETHGWNALESDLMSRLTRQSLDETSFAPFYYSELGSDGTWPGLCETGLQQSPISLNTEHSVSAYYSSPFNFFNYNTSFGGVVKNTGHWLEVTLEHNHGITIQNGGIPIGLYTFEFLRFHWNSEHTIDGKRYALEALFVHRNTKYPTYSDASGKSDGLVILSVMFYLGTNDHPVIKSILDSATAGRVLETEGTSAPLTSPLTLKDLLPSNTCAYFKYRGSRTSPRCEEEVTRVVFASALPISENQLDRLKKMASTKHQDHPTLVSNFRELQALNGRTVAFQESCKLFGFF